MGRKTRYGVVDVRRLFRPDSEGAIEKEADGFVRDVRYRYWRRKP